MNYTVLLPVLRMEFMKVSICWLYCLDFFFMLALICVDLGCNLNLNVFLELLQVLQLEETCSQAPLFLITFCGLTTSHRYVIAFIYFFFGALPTVCQRIPIVLLFTFCMIKSIFFEGQYLMFLISCVCNFLLWKLADSVLWLAWKLIKFMTL